MRKKLLSCVLVLALVFSLIPAFSLTAGAWTSAGGTVIVEGYLRLQ